MLGLEIILINLPVDKPKTEANIKPEDKEAEVQQADSSQGTEKVDSEQFEAKSGETTETQSTDESSSAPAETGASQKQEEKPKQEENTQNIQEQKPSAYQAYLTPEEEEKQSISQKAKLEKQPVAGTPEKPLKKIEKEKDLNDWVRQHKSFAIIIGILILANFLVGIIFLLNKGPVAKKGGLIPPIPTNTPTPTPIPVVKIFFSPQQLLLKRDEIKTLILSIDSSNLSLATASVSLKFDSQILQLKLSENQPRLFGMPEIKQATEAGTTVVNIPGIRLTGAQQIIKGTTMPLFNLDVKALTASGTSKISVSPDTYLDLLPRNATYIPKHESAEITVE